MATKRDPGSRSKPIRDAFSDYLDNFGNTLTLRSNTRTTDHMGRTTAFTATTASISCDIQWVNRYNIAKINSGDVEIGDGVLYVKHDQTINIDDQIEYSSDYWRVVSQVEGEIVNNDIIYKAYIIRLEKQ